MNILLITNNMDKCYNVSSYDDPVDNEYYGLNVLMLIMNSID